MMSELVLRLRLAQRGRCFHCGEPMRFTSGNHALRWSREHLFPRARYGTGTCYVLAHRGCNSVRHDTEPTPAELERARGIYASMGEHFRTPGKSHPLRVSLGPGTLGRIADLWPGGHHELARRVSDRDR